MCNKYNFLNVLLNFHRILRAPMTPNFRPRVYEKLSSKNMKRSIILLFCISCVFCDLQIYLSPEGSDTTGDGSLQNPYLSISQAVIDSNSQPGVPVQLYFSPGTYNVQSGSFTVFNAPLNASYLDDGTGQNVTINCPFSLPGLVTKNQDLIVNGANKMMISGCGIAIGIFERGIATTTLQINSVFTSYSTGTTIVAYYANVSINQLNIDRSTALPFAFESSNVTITNSTITAGYVQNCGQFRASSVATITNSTFNGICIFSQASGFANSLFVNSSLFIDSAIRTEGADTVIGYSQFSSGAQSAIEVDGGTLTLTNSTVHDIIGSNYGALNLQEVENVTITECTFFKNQGNLGASIYISGSPNFQISNATFYNNTAVQNGSAIYCDFQDNYNTTLSIYQNITLAGNNTKDPVVCPGFVYPANYFEDENEGDAENTDEPNDLTWLWIVLGVVGGIAVLAVLVAVAVIIVKKRKQSYKEIL